MYKNSFKKIIHIRQEKLRQENINIYIIKYNFLIFLLESECKNCKVSSNIIQGLPNLRKRTFKFMKDGFIINGRGLHNLWKEPSNLWSEFS